MAPAPEHRRSFAPVRAGMGIEHGRAAHHQLRTTRCWCACARLLADRRDRKLGGCGWRRRAPVRLRAARRAAAAGDGGQRLGAGRSRPCANWPAMRRRGRRAGRAVAALSTLESPPADRLRGGHAHGAGDHARCAASVVLDRLQDAGNVGTILRSAAAFGSRGCWRSRARLRCGRPRCCAPAWGRISGCAWSKAWRPMRWRRCRAAGWPTSSHAARRCGCAERPALALRLADGPRRAGRVADARTALRDDAAHPAARRRGRSTSPPRPRRRAWHESARQRAWPETVSTSAGPAAGRAGWSSRSPRSTCASTTATRCPRGASSPRPRAPRRGSSPARRTCCPGGARCGSAPGAPGRWSGRNTSLNGASVEGIWRGRSPPG